MGAAGVPAAASSVFFSYIGFDAASTAGEEAQEPEARPAAGHHALDADRHHHLRAGRRAAIGARDWSWFDGTEAALVQIVERNDRTALGRRWSSPSAPCWPSPRIVLTVLYGQTRILLAMSRDGLVPAVFGKVSTRAPAPRLPAR